MSEPNNHLNDLMFVRKNNSMRPPDWRWRRAVLIKDRGLEAPNEEKITKQVIEYLKLADSVTPEELAAQYPVLYEVDRIYSDAQETRWILEGLLMTGMDQERISQYFGFENTDIVAAYEELKFDVRSRLKFSGFILSTVLDSVGGGALPPSEEKIWKALGWIGFRSDLKENLLLAYLDIGNMPKEVQDWFDWFIRTQFKRKTFRAVMKTDPTRNPLLLDTIKAYNDINRYELEQAQAGYLNDQDDPIAKRQKQLLEALNMTPANPADNPDGAIETQLNQMELDVRQQVEQEMAALPEKTDGKDDEKG